MTDNEREIEKDDKQLEELQHDIDQVRSEADPKAKREPKYTDSGTTGEEYDDQTIVPG